MHSQLFAGFNLSSISGFRWNLTQCTRCWLAYRQVFRSTPIECCFCWVDAVAKLWFFKSDIPTVGYTHDAAARKADLSGKMSEGRGPNWPTIWSLKVYSNLKCILLLTNDWLKLHETTVCIVLLWDLTYQYISTLHTIVSGCIFPYSQVLLMNSNFALLKKQ